jgi:hypothetical protein
MRLGKVQSEVIQSAAILESSAAILAFPAAWTARPLSCQAKAPRTEITARVTTTRPFLTRSRRTARIALAFFPVPQWSAELDTFQTEARHLLEEPPPEPPDGVFAPG